MINITITDAKNSPGKAFPFRFITNAEELDAVFDDFSFEGDIVAEGEYVNTGRSYRVSGQISCTKSFICDRCLEPSREEQVHDFSEDFRQGQEGSGSENVCEDVNYFDGESVDIAPMVRDVLLADQPLNNICNADCRGLCLKCGANLNHGDCGCDRTVIDPRLAALQQLLVKK